MGDTFYHQCCLTCVNSNPVACIQLLEGSIEPVWWYLSLRRERSAAQVEKLAVEASLLKSQLSSSQRALEDAQEKTRQAESQHKVVIQWGGGGRKVISAVDSFCMQNELRLKDQVKSLQEKLSAVCLSVHVCGVYIVIQPGFLHVVLLCNGVQEHCTLNVFMPL